MDNRINEIRKQIRALRTSMIEAEAVMRAQINRDEDCSFVAGEVLRMRSVMSRLVAERTELGDREPIVVNAVPPRRSPAMPPAVARPAKRHLLPSRQRA
jgi:hypothetical protein